MERRTGRRGGVFATLTAAVMATAAQSEDIRGTIAFEGEANIPKGRIELRLRDPALDDATPGAGEGRLESDGKSERLAFAVPVPPGSTASPTLQVVARLERPDGWLIARGSAKAETDAPVRITLFTTMY